ncbi:hypothetical protein FWH09_01100, partial [Candidatus Saccharibacteria bacterium]|nr:hypothetical protein [Candidatus Saccharibacteria bacterium]
MKSYERDLGGVIEEVCNEEKIALESYSYGYFFRLNNGAVDRYIFENKFGLNTASAVALCTDKSAASDVLRTFNIPNVRHEFYMSPV